MKIKFISYVTALTGAMALTACSTNPTYDNAGYGYQNSTSPTYSSYNCGNCGIVDAVNIVETQGSGGPGLGTVIGGVAGGLIGHQIGSGSGNTAATIAGAAGGAYAGNKIENARRTTSAYRFSVRMNDGSYATVTQDTNPGFRVGDPVRIVDGRVVAR